MDIRIKGHIQGSRRDADAVTESLSHSKECGAYWD
jgi:hypothetical protein